MGEFQPMTSFERDITFGPKVETSVEQRIKDTAEKISRDKILEPDSFASEPDRNLKANEVIESLGFSSYIDMVDAMVDPNRPAVQEKAKTSFDILARSMALAMNYGGSPELQTRVNLGSTTITEVEPFYWQYVNSGKPDVVLAERVMEVSVTNKDILDRAKKIDKLRRRIDFSNEVEKKSWIGILEKEVTEVLNMDIGDDKEHELLGFKAYLSTEVAVLKGEFNSRDGSVDGIDEDVINPGSRRERTTGRPEGTSVRCSDYLSDEEERVLADSQYDLEQNTRSWDLSPLYMAVDFKIMNGRMGWRLDTPAEWYKNAPKEVRDRIDVMITMCGAAAGLASAGKDLEYVMKNDSAFKFKNIEMSQLFSPSFKLVMSRMINDLCEFYVDSNGRQVLKYKEKYYKLAGKEERSDEFGFFLDSSGKRVTIPDTVENEGKGARVLDEHVLSLLEHFEDYKDHLAQFLAEQNGNEIKKDKDGNPILDKNGKPVRKLTYLNLFDAYTAWNLVYAMGDTSIWDRMRVLPTYDHIMSDAIRTLNPEYKAKGKMMIEKGGRLKKSDALFEAEYFSGHMAEWAIKIMELERDLGEKIPDPATGNIKEYKEKAIDGEKTLRQKVIDRKVELFPSKMYYGICDFTHGGRDLYEGSDPATGKHFYAPKIGRTEEVTLASLLMNYAYKKDDRGNLVMIPKEQRREFTFGDKTTTFQNEFHDMLEGAVVMSESIMGKAKGVKLEEPATVKEWARKIKTAIRMVNGIKMNDSQIMLYGRNPSLWRDVIIGTFGCDLERLSSDHPYMLVPTQKSGYSQSYADFVYEFLTKTDYLSLSDSEINIVELMKLLGVEFRPGEKPDELRVATNNEKIAKKERERTKELLRLQGEKSDFGFVTKEMSELAERVNRVVSTDKEIERLKAEFRRVSKLGSGFGRQARTIVEEIEAKSR